MMNNLQSNKFKDKEPRETIINIRNILNKLNIIPIEKKWHTYNNYHSVNLDLPDIGININGKGSSYYYALASAYGELMERLQNFTFFKFNNPIDKKTMTKHSFYFAPDEKKFSLEDYVNLDCQWLKNQINKNKNFISILSNIYSNEILALSYVNLFTEKISFIPEKLVLLMYMSNGMCAGNTKEEALINGLSEIIERYVNIYTYENEICPPNIPYEFLNKYPKIKQMLEYVNNNTEYNLFLKDLSLGQNFPVVSAVLINKSKHSYFIKFGCHPMFEIAAEKALTELFQGQNLNNIIGLSTFKCNIEKKHNKLINTLINGIGEYPSNFFYNKPDYAFKPFPLEDATSNIRLSNYLINLIKFKNYNIYIRDVSFLGFPTYHIIVPGLSEIQSLKNEIAVNDSNNLLKIKKVFLKGYDYNNLVNIFLENHYSLLINPNNIMGFSNDSLPWYFKYMGLYLTVHFLSEGNYTMSYEVLDSFLNSVDSSTYKMHDLTCCLLNYIGMKKEHTNTITIKNTLLNFYNSKLVNRIFKEFEYKKVIIEKLNCFNCKNCKYNQKCTYPQKRDLYLNLKDFYLDNLIDQSSLIYANKKLL